MNEVHLNELIRIGDDGKGYIGNNSLSWANYVLPNSNEIDICLDRQFNRYELFEYCNNPKNDNLNVIIAILSWGGMRRDHGIRLFNNLEYLNPIIDDLRNNIYQTRFDAFNAFQEQRSINNLPGLGIGYFTKLICFLDPNLNGYIMDQWVGKSVNLLTGENLVSITSNSWVNDNNDANTYESFCSHIDNLAIILNCEGIEAEKQIFSVGRGKGLWRKYLINNYS